MTLKPVLTRLSTAQIRMLANLTKETGIDRSNLIRLAISQLPYLLAQGRLGAESDAPPEKRPKKN